MNNVIPRQFKKITFKSKITTNATRPGDVFCLIDEDGHKYELTQDGKRWFPNYSFLRNSEACEMLTVER